jgi:hypothetical protein
MGQRRPKLVGSAFFFNLNMIFLKRNKIKILSYIETFCIGKLYSFVISDSRQE